jgi:hypothetical protein
LVLENVWFTNVNNIGLTINEASGGVVDGIMADKLRVFNNRQHGMLLQSGTNIQVANSMFCGNSLGTSNTYDGFLVNGAGVSHYSLQGSTSGLCAGYGATQRYGINIASSGEYYRILGNDLYGNATSALANPSPSAHGEVRDNLGYNPVGMSSISVGSSPFTYTAGPTPEVVYIQGGTVSAVVRGSTTICTASPCSLLLGVGTPVVVTYSSAPTMTKDVQ